MTVLRSLVLVATLLCASVVFAAPRSIDDCEAIKEPDAYNRCLGSFGPVRGQHNSHRGAGMSHGANRHGRGYPSRASAQRTRTGRVRMEFSPGQGR
jgi:hypothetical protein